MTEPGLIVAIVASGIFGTALLWLGTYYLHRYIHKRCLELDHWFHWHVKREDYGNEKTSDESRSPPRRGRPPQDSGKEGSGSKERQSRSRRRHTSPRDKSTERRGEATFQDSPRIRPKDQLEESSTESMRESPKQRSRARPMKMVEGTWERPPAPGCYPQTPHAYQPRIETPAWQQQMAFQMPPQVAMPVQYPMPAFAVAPVVFPVACNTGYEQPYAEPYEVQPLQSASDKSAEAGEPSPQLGPRIIDFIMECDELPPILRKAPQSSQNFDREPSGDEIDGVDDAEIQQIPRAYIPRSVPRAAVSPYPQATATPQPNFWNITPAPVSERRTRRVRYAPYIKDIGQRRRLKNADRKRLASSNALHYPSIFFEMYKTPTWRRPDNDQPSQVTRKARIQSERREVMGECNERPQIEQGEPEGVDALAQGIEGERSCEEGDHEVDAEERKPAATLAEKPIYAEQVSEPQQYCDTEPLAPETEIEVEMIEEMETELDRRPILLGMAPLVDEETTEPLAPASSHRDVRPMPPAPTSSRGNLHSTPASPSTLISSLHRSDVMRCGRMSGQGSRRGSDIYSSGANGYEENSNSVVGGTIERMCSETLMGRGSIIPSSLDGWEADDLGRRDGW